MVATIWTLCWQCWHDDNLDNVVKIDNVDILTLLLKDWQIEMWPQYLVILLGQSSWYNKTPSLWESKSWQRDRDTDQMDLRDASVFKNAKHMSKKHERRIMSELSQRKKYVPLPAPKSSKASTCITRMLKPVSLASCSLRRKIFWKQI